ncbi:hypothetical protein N7523_001316 [Penicillium sp. IBT 18751x]|nr:hypothetical protein N7523_001316 [Penicillium sp. IBT 18751x]
MQGVSCRERLKQNTQVDWQQVAYYRSWMHRYIIHEAPYKLVYWYNEDFGLEGTRPGVSEKWELFDLEERTC